jgi:hypothetical protein
MKRANNAPARGIDRPAKPNPDGLHPMRCEQRWNYYLQLPENPARTVASHHRDAHQLHDVPAFVADSNLQLGPPYFYAEKHKYPSDSTHHPQ